LFLTNFPEEPRIYPVGEPVERVISRSEPCGREQKETLREKSKAIACSFL
jgi:hypothetical protein